MAIYESQKKALNKYLNKFDEFKIRLPLGYKDKIKKHISDHTDDDSVNAFFKRAIDETMERDK